MRAAHLAVSAPALAAAALLALPAAAQAPRIGTAAIAVNQVSGTLPGQQRKLRAGDGVFQSETLATGPNSNAQMIFNDETALTMGPDSRVVLDKLIYDPDKRSGEVALRAVSGAFRFVSGSAPKDKYLISTPKGTIGIRGTVLEFKITPDLLTLVLHQGSATYCAEPGKCVTLTQPGTFIVSDGARYSRPQPTTSLGCGTGSCLIAGGSGQSAFQSGATPGPGVTPPAGPVSTPNFRDLHNQFQQRR